MDPSKNIFEYFPTADLSFLSGLAILIPMSEFKAVQDKRDHVINLLSQFYSKELSHCQGSAEDRLAALFSIKDKWTKGELEVYLE